MNDPLQMVEVVRQACIETALRAYDDAGLSGLCHEGRWECAVDAMRAFPLGSRLQARLHATDDAGGWLIRPLKGHTL